MIIKTLLVKLIVPYKAVSVFRLFFLTFKLIICRKINIRAVLFLFLYLSKKLRNCIGKANTVRTFYYKLTVYRLNNPSVVFRRYTTVFAAADISD